MKRALLAIALASACAQNFAQEALVTIPPGYYTGNMYMRLSADDRVMYLAGAVDGFLTAAAFGAPEKGVKWLSSCIAGMEAGQLLAIVNKWMAENPREWSISMQMNAHRALYQACRTRR